MHESAAGAAPRICMRVVWALRPGYATSCRGRCAPDMHESAAGAAPRICMRVLWALRPGYATSCCGRCAPGMQACAPGAAARVCNLVLHEIDKSSTCLLLQHMHNVNDCKFSPSDSRFDG